jgi:hypothetical protein
MKALCKYLDRIKELFTTFMPQAQTLRSWIALSQVYLDQDHQTIKLPYQQDSRFRLPCNVGAADKFIFEQLIVDPDLRRRSHITKLKLSKAMQGIGILSVKIAT